MRQLGCWELLGSGHRSIEIHSRDLQRMDVAPTWRVRQPEYVRLVFALLRPPRGFSVRIHFPLLRGRTRRLGSQRCLRVGGSVHRSPATVGIQRVVANVLVVVSGQRSSVGALGLAGRTERQPSVERAWTADSVCAQGDHLRACPLTGGYSLRQLWSRRYWLGATRSRRHAGLHECCRKLRAMGDVQRIRGGLL